MHACKPIVGKFKISGTCAGVSTQLVTKENQMEMASAKMCHGVVADQLKRAWSDCGRFRAIDTFKPVNIGVWLQNLKNQLHIEGLRVISELAGRVVGAVFIFENQPVNFVVGLGTVYTLKNRVVRVVLKSQDMPLSTAQEKAFTFTVRNIPVVQTYYS